MDSDDRMFWGIGAVCVAFVVWVGVAGGGDPVDDLTACSVSSPPCITADGLVMTAVPNLAGEQFFTLDEWREIVAEGADARRPSGGTFHPLDPAGDPIP